MVFVFRTKSLGWLAGLFLGWALLFGSTRVAKAEGIYQRTKDGKTLVWNDYSRSGEVATWSGGRDSNGYATGFGTLTWYRTQKRADGESKPTLYAYYFGNMVRGKFNGPVNSHSNRITSHAVFIEGKRMSRWAAGPVSSWAMPRSTAGKAATESEPKLASESGSRSEAVQSKPQNVESKSEDVQVAVARPPPPKSEIPAASPGPQPNYGASPRPGPNYEAVREQTKSEPSVDIVAKEQAKSDVKADEATNRQPKSEPSPDVAANEPTKSEQDIDVVANNPAKSEPSPEIPAEGPPPEAAKSPSQAEVEASLEALTRPPPALEQPEQGAPDQTLGSAVSQQDHLSKRDVINLSDLEARKRGYDLSRYDRPQPQFDPIDNIWCLSYVDKSGGVRPPSPKYFTVAVDDKTKKTAIVPAR